ncbi:MAG: nucleotidyltransferase [Hyphomicrobium sp.]|jgi:hypothetical protein|nr:nucleotidyltransferase [Hyphomicrobium sp.]MBN9276791.1 nucleotidyltransferase [Hyphomicrobium sp.]
MNDVRFQPLGPGAPVGEILLAGTAVRIELPPSKHQLAVERYEAVRTHVERAESPLHDKVRIFYPQGSMAIRATITSRKRGDGYDIDIVAELILPLDTPPGRVLDLLFEAINGPRGSRYHGMVERQSRCVTVHYADGMHLDITPTILVDAYDPRRSILFHAKAEEPTSRHHRLPMNSYAFCAWFNERTPVDLAFARAYANKAMLMDERAEADVVPVPDHSTVEGGKSAAVVALQLLKRNRNIRYARRAGRSPPSVMMAKFSGDAAASGSSISGALSAISAVALANLENAARRSERVDVRNPCCIDDRFTDRWPEDLAAQRTYIDDLKLFQEQLEALMSDRLSLADKQQLLIAMFGEGPAMSVVEDYARSLGQAVETGSRSIGTGGRVLPTTSITAPTILRPSPAQPKPHTFYGTPWRRR